MKKSLSVLFFVMLVGMLFFLSSSKADEARTKTRLRKATVGARTVVTSHGGNLYRIDGFASSSNCTYSVHDASNVQGGTATTEGTVNNVLGEGGEATQYDSFPTVDFGEDGIAFNSGLIIETTTCTVVVQYD